MARLDVDKMRRYAERGREVDEARERKAWLASLTPEHRSIHERAVAICSICLQDGFRRAGEWVERAAEQMRQANAPR